jgi:uncharacterized membrane protein
MPLVPASGSWRLAGAAAAFGAYAIASHLMMAHAPDHPWTVAALFGPLWAVLVVSAWSRRQWPWLLGCAAALAAVVAVVLQGGIEDVHLMYLLQHGGIHAALAAMFGLTLRPGGTPFITALALRVHRTVTPPMQQYTRRLTQIWVAYFLGMIALSFALYALAPWSWWSLFCNVITPLAVLVLFVGEQGWRRLRHPEFELVSPMRVLQAFRQRASEGGPR